MNELEITCAEGIKGYPHEFNSFRSIEYYIEWKT